MTDAFRKIIISMMFMMLICAPRDARAIPPLWTYHFDVQDKASFASIVLNKMSRDVVDVEAYHPIGGLLVRFYLRPRVDKYSSVCAQQSVWASLGPYNDAPVDEGAIRSVTSRPETHVSVEKVTERYRIALSDADCAANVEAAWSDAPNAFWFRRVTDALEQIKSSIDEGNGTSASYKCLSAKNDKPCDAPLSDLRQFANAKQLSIQWEQGHPLVTNEDLHEQLDMRFDSGGMQVKSLKLQHFVPAIAD